MFVRISTNAINIIALQCIAVNVFTYLYYIYYVICNIYIYYSVFVICLTRVKFKKSVQAAFYMEHKMVRRLVTASLPMPQSFAFYRFTLLCNPQLNAVLILHYTSMTLPPLEL